MIDKNIYNKISSKNLSNLGKINIWEKKENIDNKVNNVLIEKVEIFSKEKNYRASVQNKIERLNFNKNVNIINNLENFYDDKNLTIYSYFENFNYSLNNIKKSKYKLNSSLVFLEVLNLIKNIWTAIYYLQEDKQLIHGNIRPSNIIVIKNKNKDKIFKLVDSIGKTLPPDKQQLYNLKNNKKIYISPEFLNELSIEDSNKEYEFDPFKSEVFSLGLVVLELLIDEDIQDLYKKVDNICIFNETKLIDYLDIIKRKDIDIFFIWMNMLHISEEERKYPDEIIQIINMYLNNYNQKNTKDISIQCNLEVFDNDNFIYIYKGLNENMRNKNNKNGEINQLFDKIDRILNK